MIIPDSVESIDYEAFNECSKLASVAFGNKLTSIGGYSFYGCTSLKRIAIPASVTYIGYGAFQDDNSLISVTFAANSNLTTMGTEGYYGEGVFQNCTGLKSVILPDKLTSMGYCLFSGCTNLESVVLGKHITSISRYAFENCTSLKKIVLPKSLTSIDYYAFLNCSSLNTVKYTGSEARWNDLKNDGINTDGTGIPLSITSPPESVKVSVGSSATFTVKANGSGLKYQWYFKNSTQTSWSKWGTTSTPTKSAVTTDKWDKMQVRCKVTDSSGDYEYSDIATVTIIIPLKILQEPKNIEVLPGQKGTFTVKASGTGLKYQWYYKSKSATKWSAWSGQTKATVTAKTTSKWNGMQVRCKVTDTTGKSVYSNAATVTIAAASTLKITQQPKNVTASADDVVPFVIKASGTGLKYQWYIKKSGQTSWKAWSGRTSAAFFSTANSSWNGMQVRCIVTDSTGKTVTSNTVKVTIK